MLDLPSLLLQLWGQTAESPVDGWSETERSRMVADGGDGAQGGVGHKRTPLMMLLMLSSLESQCVMISFDSE